MGILNHKGITWQDEKLVIAIEPNEKVAVEEILDGYDYDICWQSKYNAYCNFYTEPPCDAGFILNYIIQGNYYSLLLLKWKMEMRDQQVKHLQTCLG